MKSTSYREQKNNPFDRFAALVAQKVAERIAAQIADEIPAIVSGIVEQATKAIIGELADIGKAPIRFLARKR